MNAQIKQQVNEAALRRFVPHLHTIHTSTSHVVLYRWMVDGSAWQKAGIEGTLFLYEEAIQSTSATTNGLFIINRLGLDNFQLPLLPSPALQMSLQGDYILLKGSCVPSVAGSAETSTESLGSTENIVGLWIFEEPDRLRILEALRHYSKAVSHASTPFANAHTPLTRLGQTQHHATPGHSSHHPMAYLPVQLQPGTISQMAPPLPNIHPDHATYPHFQHSGYPHLAAHPSSQQPHGYPYAIAPTHPYPIPSGVSVEGPLILRHFGDVFTAIRDLNSSGSNPVADVGEFHRRLMLLFQNPHVARQLHASFVQFVSSSPAAIATPSTSTILNPSSSSLPPHRP